MTRKQALEAIIDGYAVTHKLIWPRKFIFLRGGKFYDNQGEILDIQNEPVKMLTCHNTSTMDGWELVHPEEIRESKIQSKRFRINKLYIVIFLILLLAYFLVNILLHYHKQ